MYLELVSFHIGSESLTLITINSIEAQNRDGFKMIFHLARLSTHWLYDQSSIRDFDRIVACKPQAYKPLFIISSKVQKV